VPLKVSVDRDMRLVWNPISTWACREVHEKPAVWGDDWKLLGSDVVAPAFSDTRVAILMPVRTATCLEAF
jgi:hypothetical protein